MDRLSWVRAYIAERGCSKQAAYQAWSRLEGKDNVTGHTPKYSGGLGPPSAPVDLSARLDGLYELMEAVQKDVKSLLRKAGGDW